MPNTAGVALQEFVPTVIALVQAGPLGIVTRWVAKIMSNNPTVIILVCGWWQLGFTADQVLISGRIWQADRGDGRLRRAVVHGLPIDVLYFDGSSGGTTPSTPEEHDALARLAPLQITHPGLLRRQIVHQLLLEASRRGVVTNANADYESWDAKDGLEITLRRYEQASGQVIPRPLTYCVSAPQLPIIMQELSDKGILGIVKQAKGSLGRGLRIVSPGVSPGRRLPSGRYVVQELVTDPLLVDGRKADLRCHLLIDPESRQASRWVPPILLQVAGCPYAPGSLDAENANPLYQRRRGYDPLVVPLPEAAVLSARLRNDIQAAVQMLSEQLIDAYFRLATDIGDDRVPRRRTFLWGFDVAVAAPHHQVRVYLLDNSTRPQLYWGQAACDQAMAALIRQHHLDALLHRHRMKDGPG